MRTLLPALLIFGAALQIPLYPQADNPGVSRETLEKAQHRQAIQDGLSSADDVARMYQLRNQLAAGRVSRAAVEKYEREAKAMFDRRHAKWAATRYLGAYENAYRRAFDDPDYRLRAFEELDRPSFWSSWRLPSFRTSWSLPASVTAFVTEWAGLLILGAVLTIMLAGGWYLQKIGWEPEKKDTALPPLQPIWTTPDTYGSAEWAEPRAWIPDQLYTFGGVFFGKSSSPEFNHAMPVENHLAAPICSTPSNHVLIVARTRTGKLTRVLAPTLLRYMNCCIVVDPKGESCAITARARASAPFNNEIHIVNPWGVLDQTFRKLGFPRASFNPLDILDINDPNVTSIAEDLALTICPPATSAKDPFWDNSAASMLTAVLLWITYQPGEIKTLARAREIITKPKQELTDDFLIPMAAVSNPAWRGIYQNAGPFIGMANDTFSSVMGNLAQHTRFLSDPQLDAAASTSTFSMRDIHMKPSTLYLVIPQEKMNTQRTWLRLVLTVAMKSYTMQQSGPKPLRCLFIIDELPVLGYIDELPKTAISTMAGYGVDFLLVVQGLDQLKAIYHDYADTILNNCAYKWFCNVSDLHTAEYLSKALGNKTVRTTGESVSQGQNPGGGSSGSSTTHGEAGRPLLMPSEILNLGRDAAILFAPGDKPHYLRPVDYWDLDKAFANLRKVYPMMYWEPDLTWDPNPLHRK